MASFLGFGCDLGRDPINWDPSPISFVSRKNEEASQAHTHTHTHTLMVSTLLSLRLTDRILMRKEKQQAFSTRVRLSSSRTTLSTLVHLDKALFFKEREPLMKGEFLPQKERLSLLKSPLVPVERRKRSAGFPQERDLSPSKGLFHAHARRRWDPGSALSLFRGFASGINPAPDHTPRLRIGSSSRPIRALTDRPADRQTPRQDGGR